MHLDEEVEPVAQKTLVLNRRHAVEHLEELLLLLARSWKHVSCLNVIERFWPGGKPEGGARNGISAQEGGRGGCGGRGPPSSPLGPEECTGQGAGRRVRRRVRAKASGREEGVGRRARRRAERRGGVLEAARRAREK
eukprot:scaffold6318_cov56-Phaeocystis_antarctica.AAC.1